MKELSIEQKAKAYDELKVKAQELTEDGYIDKLALLDLFPELAESEDERMRKELIKHLKEGADGYEPAGDSEDYKRWLGWLEKQCEKESVTCPICGWGIKKQGEQKSAIEMKSAEESLGIDSETYNKIVDECIYGEQKPADKVESNKKFTPIESALKDLICDVDNSYTIEQVRRFLFVYGYKDKILNAAQEEMQKPAVWSEEDESYLNTTIAYLKDAREFKKTAENCINWLKSLKPQNRWKPSDEQMSALSDINCTGCISYAGQGQELINLYNDLKRLLKKRN